MTVDKAGPSEPIKIGQLTIRYLIDGTACLRVDSASRLACSTATSQYFRDAAAIISAGEPTDRAKLIGVMFGYGLEPAPPQ